MGAVETPVEHRSLSAYLGDVQRAVKRALPEPEWLVAELSAFNVSGKGSVFIDLLETANGQEVAKARGVMYANVASKVLAQWRTATGGIPQAGMKVLVKVRAEFSVQYGFSLQVTAIDPSYTLGDMQAKVQEIISALKGKGWFDLQRGLPAPTGFWRVAVISPHEAAGLADFRRDAQELSKSEVCEFEYFAATFQGRDASESLRAALKAVYDRHQLEGFDAVCVIRGGGSKADLAWLNDQQVAAWLCRLPIPAFTGIGHQVDQCVLDLVAQRQFDTPSKVIGFIKTSLQAEAAGLQTQMEKISSSLLRMAANQVPILERSGSRFATSVRQLLHAESKRLLVAQNELRRGSTQVITQQRQSLQIAPDAFRRLSEGLCQGERGKLALASAQMASSASLVVERARSKLEFACELYERTNPLTLLSRGFALVRDAEGAVVISAAQAQEAGRLYLAFSDAVVTAAVEKV